jgi:hypothetical protein
MSSNYTPQEWAEKASWEGGAYEALAYGLGADDLEPHADATFREIVEAAESAYLTARKALERLDDLINDMLEDAGE